MSRLLLLLDQRVQVGVFDSDVVFDQIALRQKCCVSDCFSLSDCEKLKALSDFLLRSIAST
jgi:hypothetical protein